MVEEEVRTRGWRVGGSDEFIFSERSDSSLVVAALTSRAYLCTDDAAEESLSGLPGEARLGRSPDRDLALCVLVDAEVLVGAGPDLRGEGFVLAADGPSLTVLRLR